MSRLDDLYQEELNKITSKDTVYKKQVDAPTIFNNDKYNSMFQEELGNVVNGGYRKPFDKTAYTNQKNAETVAGLKLNLMNNGVPVPKSDIETKSPRNWFEKYIGDPVSSLQYGLFNGIKSLADNNPNTTFGDSALKGLKAGFNDDKANKVQFKDVLQTLLNSNSAGVRNTTAVVNNILNPMAWGDALTRNESQVDIAKKHTGLTGFAGDVLADPLNLIGGIGEGAKVLSKGSKMLKGAEVVGDASKAEDVLKALGKTGDLTKDAEYLAGKTAKKLGYLDDYQGVYLGTKNHNINLLKPETVGNIADTAIGKTVGSVLGVPGHILDSFKKSAVGQDLAVRFGGKYAQLMQYAKKNPEDAMKTIAYIDEFKKGLNNEMAGRLAKIKTTQDAQKIIGEYESEITRAQELGDTVKEIQDIIKVPNEDRAAKMAEIRDRYTKQADVWQKELDNLNTQAQVATDLPTRVALQKEYAHKADLLNMKKNIADMSDEELQKYSESLLQGSEGLVKKTEDVSPNAVKETAVEPPNAPKEDVQSVTPKEEVKPTEVPKQQTIEEQIHALDEQLGRTPTKFAEGTTEEQKQMVLKKRQKDIESSSSKADSLIQEKKANTVEKKSLEDTYKEINAKDFSNIPPKLFDRIKQLHEDLKLPMDMATADRYKALSEAGARDEIKFLEAKQAKRLRLNDENMVKNKLVDLPGEKLTDVSKVLNIGKKLTEAEYLKEYSDISERLKKNITKATQDKLSERLLSMAVHNPEYFKDSKILVQKYLEDHNNPILEKIFSADSADEFRRSVAGTNVLKGISLSNSGKAGINDYIEKLAEKVGVKPRFDIRNGDFEEANVALRYIEKGRLERKMFEKGNKNFAMSGEVTDKMAQMLADKITKYFPHDWIKEAGDDLTRDIKYMTKEEYQKALDPIKSMRPKPIKGEKTFLGFRFRSGELEKPIQEQARQYVRDRFSDSDRVTLAKYVNEQRKTILELNPTQHLDLPDVRKMSQKTLMAEAEMNIIEQHAFNKQFNIEGKAIGKDLTDKGINREDWLQNVTTGKKGEVPLLDSLDTNNFEYVKHLIETNSNELNNVSDGMLHGIIERDLNKVETDAEWKQMNEDFKDARFKALPMTAKQQDFVQKQLKYIKDKRPDIYETIKEEFKPKTGSHNTIGIASREQAGRFLDRVKELTGNSEFASKALSDKSMGVYKDKLLKKAQALWSKGNAEGSKKLMDTANLMQSFLNGKIKGKDGRITTYAKYQEVSTRMQKYFENEAVKVASGETKEIKTAKDIRAVQQQKALANETIKDTPKETLVESAKTPEAKVSVAQNKEAVDTISSVLDEATRNRNMKIEELTKKLNKMNNLLNNEELFTKNFETKYGKDYPAYVEMMKKTYEVTKGVFDHLPDPVKHVAESLREEFKQMGIDEGILTREQADNGLYRYVTHIFNKDRSYFDNVEKQIGVKNPENKYELERTGFFKDKTIEEINNYAKEHFGIDNYVEDRISKIYLQRALASNKYLADQKRIDDFVNTFGKRFDLHIKPQEGDTEGMKAYKDMLNEFNSYRGGEYSIVSLDKEYKPINLDGLEGDELKNALSQNLNANPFIDYGKKLDEQFFEKVKQPVYIVPSELHKNFLETMQGQYKQNTSALKNLYEKFTHLWKAQALFSTSFHVNNAMGNTFNGYLNVGSKIFNPKYNAYAVQIMTENGSLLGKTAKEWKDIAREYGVLEHTQSNVDLGAFKSGATKLLQDRKTTPLQKLSKPFGLSQAFGSTIEEQARLTNFIIHIADGKTPQEAADMVDKYLFDYSDLSQFEQNTMRNIMPFYTWFRKNLPLQVSQVLTQPEKYGKIYRAERDIQKPETDEQKKYRPDYLDTALHAGDGKYVKVNLPYEDLQKATSVKDLVSSMNPFAKLAAELITGKNIYLGTDIPKEQKLQYAVDSMLPVIKSYKAIEKGDNSKITGVKVYDTDLNKLKQQAMYAYIDKLKQAEDSAKKKGIIKKTADQIKVQEDKDAIYAKNRAYVNSIYDNNYVIKKKK